MALVADASSSAPEQQSIIARALCAALAFESLYEKEAAPPKAPLSPVYCRTIIKGNFPNPMESSDDEFFDAVEFHDDNELHLAFSRSSSSIEMIRSGTSSPLAFVPPCEGRSSRSPVLSAQQKNFDAPPPPKETPLRFIRAGKNDPVVGRQRYEQTLAWRKRHNMDTILKEPEPHFKLIKHHYPHYFHLKGKEGQYVYYEKPPQTDLKALREGGVNLDELLRHYAMVTEFSWQYIDRNDFGQSLYIIDLKGIRVTDFVGECVDFVKKTAQFTGAHYPERCGCVFVVNVPSWFYLIWKVVKPIVDEDTLKKVFILRGKDEIFESLSQKIAVENIPPEYGGTSIPLGEAPEEKLLWELMQHNNDLANGKLCKGVDGDDPCRFCTFRYARSY